MAHESIGGGPSDLLRKTGFIHTNFFNTTKSLCLTFGGVVQAEGGLKNIAGTDAWTLSIIKMDCD